MTENVPLSLVYFYINSTTVTESRGAIQAMEALGTELHERFSGTPIHEIPGVHTARRMFHELGIDPTRRRPSSEALLRRAINRKGFFAVNSHVDIGNWCSLEFLLPVCLYDLGALQFPIVLRRGLPDDAYDAINHRRMQFENKPVLVDAAGAFGSPLTDSLRSCVTTVSRDLLCCIWGAASSLKETLVSNAETFAHRLQTAGGGSISDIALISA